MRTLPLAEVRQSLSAVVEEVVRTHDAVTITRNGLPAAVVISVEEYESLLETLALLGDPRDRARLAEAEESITIGDTVTGDEMERLMRERSHRENTRGESP